MPSSSKARFTEHIAKDRYFYLILFAVLAALYLFGIRDHYSIASCHNFAEEQARERLIARVKADPDNKTLIQAAQANLYANEDYQPVYRRCLLSKGYQS